MNRLTAWINDLIGWTRGRLQSLGSAGFVAVAVIGLVVAMFLADGFRATTMELKNPGVWVTKEKLVGRFNTQAEDLDTVVSTEFDGVDVAQDGDQVAVVGAGKLQVVDPADGTIADKGVQIPVESTVHMSGGRFLIVAGSGNDAGKAWTGNAEELGAWQQGKPDARGVTADLVQLGRDGSVAALRKGGSVLLRSNSGERSEVRLEGLDAVPANAQLTLVGSKPVILDVEKRRLYLEGSDPVDVSSLGEGPALQVPGDRSDRVVVAASNGLGSVPLSGGEVSIEFENSQPAEGSLPPVYVNGCTYGAWSAGAASHEVVKCSSGDPVVGELKGIQGDLRFRVNGSSVALNDLKSGAVWVRVGDEIKLVESDWEQKGPEGETEEEGEKDKTTVDLAQEQKPPVANPDEGWGARRGRASVIPVLDNDTDENGDILTVHIKSDPQAEVTVVDQGRAVQVVPREDDSAVTFTYAAFDGTAESNPVTVSVKVFDDGDNKPPERRKDVEQRPFTVALGQAGTYDVLPDWRDPEGDPLVLAGAKPDDLATGEAHTVPAGRLTFKATGGVPGKRTIDVSVSDVPPSGAAESANDPLTVTVTAEDAQQAPDLEPDYAVGAAGTAIAIYPLRNDTDANGDPLRLVKVRTPDGWPIAPPEVSVDDGRIVVRPDATVEGKSLVFAYVATDDYHVVEGLIRVDVVAAEGNQAPSAGQDLLLLPPDDGARSVDVLVNDFDPDGDVLMVTGIDPGAATGKVEYQLLEHRRLKVWSRSVLTSPVVLLYTVTDGSDSAVGRVVVAQSPLAAANALPVTAPDAVVVRAGDVVSIPVLANDMDPDGDSLRLGSELAQGPADGQGSAFVSGSVVRFVAPPTPGTVRLTYRVTDAPPGMEPLVWSSEDVTITVRAAEENRPPSPRTVEARVLSGNTVKVVIPLSVIDPDGDSVGLAGITSDVAPTRGRVVLPIGTDSITYEAFPTDKGGPDEFSYRVVDSRGQSATGTVRIVVGVAESSAPPVARDDEVLLAPGATALVPVLANDFDPDGDPIRFADPALEDVPDGVNAEVVGSRVKVTAPGDVAPVLPFTYRITDGRTFPPVVGRVQIVVDPAAPGLPPVARDDVARPSVDQKDLSEISVDVRANDEDPDGDPAKLKVAVVSGNAAVGRDGSVIVKPAAAAQVVAYSVTDPQGLSATAVIRVPPKGELDDRPPELIPDVPKLTVPAGGDPMTIELNEFVKDPEGQEVRLTQGNLVRLAPSGVGQVDPDALTNGLIVISVPKGVAPGPAAVMFEVTDAADTNQGNKVTLSIPFAVTAAPGEEPPPALRPVAVSVGAGDDPVAVDLSTQLTSESGPADGIEFTVHKDKISAAGVQVEADGSKLTVSAAADAPVGGSPISLPVTVARGDKKNAADGVVTIAIVASTKPLPACADVEIPKADAGKESTVELKCTNPFPDNELQFGQATSDQTDVSAKVDGPSLTVTPAKGFVGTAMVTYTVTDFAKRSVKGSARVTVREVPAAPGAPVVVSEGSEQVVLRWTAPDPHGAPITKYLVEASEGGFRPFECAATANTCTITGLTNDVTYHFAVRAENEVGPGDLGPTAAARPDQKPEPPTDVKLTFDKTRLDGKLTATWTAAQSKGSKVTTYMMKVSPPVDGQPPIRDVGNVTEVQLDGLANGTAYRVQVQAVNKSLERGGEWAESNSETPAKVPDPVNTPSVSPVSDPLGMRINVSWSAPPDGGSPITGYRVAVYKEGQCAPTTTAFKELPTAAADQRMPFVVDLGEKYARYQIAVVALTKATDNKGNPAGGTATYKCSAPIQAPSRPDPVGAIQVIASEDGSNVGLDRRLRLRFAQPDAGGSPISGYEISQNGGGYVAVSPSNTQVSGTTVTLTVSGLTNGAQYSYRVRARNGTAFTSTDSPTSPTEWPYGPLGQPGISVIGSDRGGVTFRITAPPDNGRGPISVAPNGDQRVGGGCSTTVSITVTARDQAGQTTTATAQGNTAACPPPVVSASWGESASVTGCESGCRWMNVSIANFPANATVSLACQFRTGPTAGWDSNFGFDPPDLTTDGNGSAERSSGGRCVGKPSIAWEYRYVVNGVASNGLG